MKTNILLGLGGLLLLGGAAFAFTQEPLRSRWQSGQGGGQHHGQRAWSGQGQGQGFGRGQGQGHGLGQGRARAQGQGRGQGLGLGGRFSRGQGEFGGLRERIRDLKRMRDTLRSLDITPQQRERARQTAQDLKPLVEELRPKIRDVMERARELRRQGDIEGARQLLHNELRPLIEDAKARGLPLVRPLVDSLTPEQRAKCEAAARAHGREFDPERASRRLGLLLGSRRAQERLSRPKGR